MKEWQMVLCSVLSRISSEQVCTFAWVLLWCVHSEFAPVHVELHLLICEYSRAGTTDARVLVQVHLCKQVLQMAQIVPLLLVEETYSIHASVLPFPQLIWSVNTSCLRSFPFSFPFFFLSPIPCALPQPPAFPPE